MIAIFIFRRDLRIEDNTGLQWAMENYKKVIPVFIFTPEQFGDKNPYRSNSAVSFMLDALDDLNKRLCKHNSRLHMFDGDNIKVLNYLKKHIKISAVVFNKDFTPYAQARDLSIIEWGKRNGISVHSTEDYTLHNMGSILSNEGGHYAVYTAFRNKAVGMPTRKPFKPLKLHMCSLSSLNRISAETHLNICDNKSKRRQALGVLKNMRKFADYSQKRNDLTYETTHLSAHIKFGTVSIREVFEACKRNSTLVDQLLWREFYYNISYFGSPISLGRNLNTPNCPNYNGKKVNWSNSAAKFARWTEGKTGFPIVDAGMRQLNATGYMHNRARLITGNFLVRLLGCDWRIGERYFAQHLEDYDPMVNNGNWQWVAATGVDRSPESQRIFNPWRQSAKYDKDAKYIKKWIPELKDVPAKHLHKWFKYHAKYKLEYPPPIINYDIQKNKY